MLSRDAGSYSSTKKSCKSWSTALSGRFYRVTQSVELVNGPYDIKTRRDAHWALHVNPRGGGLGGGVPVLELSYFPHQLAFLARGDPPFTLAYGRHGAAPSRFDWQAVTSLLTQEQRDNLPRQSVTTGSVVELAGAVVLEPPAAPDNTDKMYLLWAVLIVGVGLLGTFSLKLARQLKQQPQ